MLTDADVGGQPIDGVRIGSFAEAHEAGIGGERAIIRLAADLMRQASVQSKAAPGERCQPCPVTPVECQKTARFAGRRTSEPGAFDDDRLDPATAQEISDRGT